MELKSGIRQRGETFTFTVCLGYDGNGKQVRKYHTYHPPKGLTEKQLKNTNRKKDAE